MSDQWATVDDSWDSVGEAPPDDVDIKNTGRYGKYWDKTANVAVRRTWYGWFIVIAIVLVGVALADIIYMESFLQWGVMGLLGAMAFASIIMFFTRSSKFAKEREYEGDLGVALLECPECKEVFSFKENRIEDHQKVAFSCPVCGTYGALPGIDSEPKKKLMPEGELRERRYKCGNCREDIRVGVYGEQSLHDSVFRACPHCGEKGQVSIVHD